MFKLGRLTDYAVVIIIDICMHDEKAHNASGVSARTGISLPTVQKILKILCSENILISHRGVHGGYQLSRAPDDISLACILSAMEGPITLTACVDGGNGDCSVESICNVRGRWDKVNKAVEGALRDVKLSQMLEDEYQLSPFMQSTDEQHIERGLS